MEKGFEQNWCQLALARFGASPRIPSEIAEEFKRKPDLNLEAAIFCKVAFFRHTFVMLTCSMFPPSRCLLGLPTARVAGPVARQEAATAAATGRAGTAASKVGAGGANFVKFIAAIACYKFVPDASSVFLLKDLKNARSAD